MRSAHDRVSDTGSDEFANDYIQRLQKEEEQQRVAVVDPGTRISFLFARCRRPTQPRYAAAAAAAAECCCIKQFAN